ncbi:MAG: sulfur carrier protein ThiS [Cyclobacteriaceae bacterium]|nr:sulfur carrier protein ThiS [Cyclobacteriaceae bacterium]
MEVTINNQIKVFPDNCSLQHVLDQVMPNKQLGIAVAINDEVIPKFTWPDYILKQHDNVLIIVATQGG